MGDIDPSVPQVNDPELEADLIRALSVVGQIGKLRVVDIVIPTISLGNVIQQTVQVLTPAYRSTDIFSAGVAITPAAATVLADTGGLPAGTYDVQVHMSTTEETNRGNFEFQHRNSGDTVTLMTAAYAVNRLGYGLTKISFGYELGDNERLRVLNIIVGGAGDRYAAVIYARRRT